MATFYDKWNIGEEGFTNLGSFETSLMETYSLADGTNRARLEEVYPDLFTERTTVDNNAIASVEKKFNYFKSRIEFGPLTSYEEGELLELLEKFGNDDTIYNIACKSHFLAKSLGQEVNDWELIEGLASQCVDDVFTMVCAFSQQTVIYLLRTVKH